MDLQLHLSQEQTIGLSLSTEMRQSIDILRLHSLDLAAYLQEQALENPMLDIRYRNSRLSVKRKLNNRGWQDTDPMASLQQNDATLEEWLTGQMRVNGTPDVLYRAAAFLAGNLDDNGYLAISLEEAAGMLNMCISFIKRALELLQSLDPPGVGARSLQECLALQVTFDRQPNPHAALIIDQHFAELAQGKYDTIAKQLKVAPVDVRGSLAYIRGLNPRPALSFHRKENIPVVPDGEIVKEEGRFTVLLFDDHLPRVCLHPNYRGWTGNASFHEAGSYLRSKFQEANQIIKSLEKRKATLYRVIQAIADEQAEFLENGGNLMKPMNLKAISQRLGLHESTISRAVQNKYVQTPVGIYELKYFFSRGLGTQNGPRTSRTGIKSKIKHLIDNESKLKPLSDNDIANLLAREEIIVSRRTVVKYREEMQILPSTLRKNGHPARVQSN